MGVLHRRLDLPHVFGLRPLRALDDLKTDAVALGEGLETFTETAEK